MAEVTTSEKDWLAEVLENDDDHYERDVVYEFSKGRKFKDTDNTDSGVYN